MTKILFALALSLLPFPKAGELPPAALQAPMFVSGRVHTSGGPCSLPPGSYAITDCFVVAQSPLAGNWSIATASGYVSANSTGAGAVPNPSNGKTIIYYSGGSASATQTAATVLGLGSGADIGVSGPCVRMGTTGNGYCYLINLQAVYVITGGAGTGPIINDCPSASGAGTDIFQLTVSGTTVQCTDVTTGAHGTAATDSTWNAGRIGAIIDNSGGTQTTKLAKFGGNQ